MNIGFRLADSQERHYEIAPTLISNDTIGSPIQSSFADDTNPVVGGSTARISFFASGVQRAAFAISIAASLSLLSWVMMGCRIGFDFTDEGFYLNWISNPWNYHSSLSQFGFVYYPLYKLVGGDVVLLRQANILMTFALTSALCFLLLRSTLGRRTSIDFSASLGAAGVAIVVASGSLSFFDIWLPTPNYNSLTFQSLLLAAIGAVLTDRELSKSGVAGWILLGAGGCLAFLAKPTSAVMLGCIMVVYLAAAGKFSARGLAISVVVAVLFLLGAALAIDGSLVGFLQRNVSGLAMAQRLTPKYTFISVFRWDGITLVGHQRGVFIWLLVLAFVTATFGFLANGLARLAAASIAIVISALVIATVSGISMLEIFRGPLQPVQCFAVATGLSLAGIIFLIRSQLRPLRIDLAATILLVALPYAYAFGTGNDYGTTAARAGIFWFLAGFVVCAAVAKIAWRQLLPAAALILLVPVGVLSAAMEHPYRQTEALRLQKNSVEIPTGRLGPFLSAETAAYVHDLQEIAYASGFRAGYAVLDLTSVSPGSLYVMGARPLGVAWTIGGYPGSTDFLAAALNDEPCEAIATSWILTEPTAPEAFSFKMLQQFGIDISADYVSVGSINSTRGFSPRKFEHQLLKPVRSAEVARMACENTRRTKTNELR
jgi:hypothetical protein